MRFKKLKNNSGMRVKESLEEKKLAHAKMIYDKYLKGSDAIFQVCYFKLLIMKDKY